VTFVPSIVENMPEATIIIDTTQTPETLLQWISSTHQRRIKKAQKTWGKYVELWEDEVDHAYDMRLKTSKKQWFTIPKRDHFKQLYHLLVDWNKWFFAARKQWDEVGAFAVIVTIWDTWFYLYGWSDSSVWVWAAQSLHWQIIQNAHRKWVKTYDLLGVSPLWKSDHHLSWVTQFKQWFGWTRIEYVWNYDYLISWWKYRLYKLRRNLRK
jgi:lipid II:glycine glycyltransferase (peptidoglycan interpeptide bridge formation enzyme)